MTDYIRKELGATDGKDLESQRKNGIRKLNGRRLVSWEIKVGVFG